MLFIPDDLVRQMLSHSVRSHPYEACGVMTGPDYDHPVRLIEMTNAANSTTRYQFDPDQQLQVWEEMDRLGHQPAVIYHSHTGSGPYPSQADREYAFDPATHYVIVSTRNPDRLDWRSYLIADGWAFIDPVVVGSRPRTYQPCL